MVEKLLGLLFDEDEGIVDHERLLDEDIGILGAVDNAPDNMPMDEAGII